LGALSNAQRTNYTADVEMGVRPILKQLHERLSKSDALNAVRSVLRYLPYDKVRQIAARLNSFYVEAPDRFWGYVVRRLAPLGDDHSKTASKDGRLLVSKQTVDDALGASMMDDMKIINDLL
jgi:hypothetical protein